MKIVLVMLNNLQSYIFDNIKNLKNYNNNDIVVITDKKFNEFFKEYNISIINIEDLIVDYKNIISNVENTFLKGFWELTSYRFEALHAYMKKYNIFDIIHIENDVLVYKDLNKIKFHCNDKLLLTMDSKERCIPGIMFIPNSTILKKCLDTFSSNKGIHNNDMSNFAKCYYKFNKEIDTLPIFIEDNSDDVKKMVTKNFKHYNAIFDAAAIGQYLGGRFTIDRKKNTVGFINQTCIFDYSKYNILWKKVNDKKIPHLIINNKEYRIINLHIHSKKLKEFM